MEGLKLPLRRSGDSFATLVITEHQGRTFKGKLKRANATGDEEEQLWGAFTPDFKPIMGSDEEGTYIFTLLNPRTLDYCYSETGARTVCARLVKQQAGNPQAVGCGPAREGRKPGCR